MTTTAIPRHWRFECEDSSPSSCVVVVQALSPAEANASPNGLQGQVEQQLRHLYASVGGNPEKGTMAAKRHFSTSEESEEEEHNLLLFVYAFNDNDNDLALPATVAGFARVYEDPEMNAVICSSFGVLPVVSETKEHEILRALFHATQEVGEAFGHSMLLQQANIDAGSKSDSISLWRGTFGASEYLRQYVKGQGFSGDRFDHLELTKFLNTEGTSADEVKAETITFPEGIVVKPLDLQQDDLVKVYDVLKMAFGGNPPSFEAWKRHFPQQPRFAPELSFAAWATGDNGNVEELEPVSVLLVERIVDGEGGGDDEVNRVYATHGELMKSKKSDNEVSNPTLEFSADFDAQKSAIEATARTAYICGVATKPSHRSQGIASKLLRLSFEKAEKTTRLEKVTLGTDRFNASAVRAYLRAGMVETQSVNPGHLVSKDI